MVESMENRETTLEAGTSVHDGTSSWERDLLSRLAFASLIEQRRHRRWNIALRLAFLGYLTLLLLLYVPFGWLSSPDSGAHTALVRLDGVIADGQEAGADWVIPGLRAAFENEDTSAVILRINSPGGSPVQAGYINDEILRLRSTYPDIPLYAVITDICASGGYYVAAAADRIFADKSSIVGSIGVLMNGFGFVEAMEMLGVERRLYTAGDRKGFLDPFSPSDPEEVAHIRNTLAELHSQFVAVVRKGRGDRLKDSEDLFSGLVWSGERSVELGLVDELGSSDFVAREVVKVDNVVDFTRKRGLLERVSERVGAAFGRVLGDHLLSAGFRLR